jgi:molybdopterin-guanine dinucleotide biosynthesis protein A
VTAALAISRDRLRGVILAGGRATRMGGGDKCLLTVAGRPLLAHVIDRLGPAHRPRR